SISAYKAKPDQFVEKGARHTLIRDNAFAVKVVVAAEQQLICPGDLNVNDPQRFGQGAPAVNDRAYDRNRVGGQRHNNEIRRRTCGPLPLQSFGFLARCSCKTDKGRLRQIAFKGDPCVNAAEFAHESQEKAWLVSWVQPEAVTMISHLQSYLR